VTPTYWFVSSTGLNQEIP